MTMFDGDNCPRKFVRFSMLLIISFAVVLTLSAFFGFIASLLVLGLLSVVLRFVVDIYGDKQLTRDKVYMSPSQIEEFEKKKLDPSKFNIT